MPVYQYMLTQGRITQIHPRRVNTRHSHPVKPPFRAANEHPILREWWYASIYFEHDEVHVVRHSPQDMIKHLVTREIVATVEGDRNKIIVERRAQIIVAALNATVPTT